MMAMDRWTFNTVLFGSLTSVLDLSIMEIAKRVHIGQQTLNRYINGVNEVPVDVLLQICNCLRMPSYFFVSEQGKYDVPNREAATIATSQWKPVRWDEQAVEHTFGDGGGRIFWKDVAVVMGVTPQKPHDRFLLRKRFTVVSFLKVCSHFGLSPFTFLIDHNRDVSKRKSRALDIDTLLAEVASLRVGVSELNGKYQDVISKYDLLLERYDTMLNAHKQLLQRFDEHVEE
jgi:transcriptional regulator with XRE-family HTH domain